MGQWSKLPINLLEVIEDHLVLYVEKVRIRTVCQSWNSGLSNMPNPKERQFPWLLQELEDSTEASHALFNPIQKKLYLLELPEAQGKLFKGSSNGWVTTVEDKHSTSPTNIYLINPVTRVQIKLPSRSKFPDVKKYRVDKLDQEYNLFLNYGLSEFCDSHHVNLSFTEKVVLSSVPSSNDYLAVAIYGNYQKLAFCRCNDKKWRPLGVKYSNDAMEFHFSDIIFHNGKLHALNDRGGLLLFESIGTGRTSKVTLIASVLDLNRGHDLRGSAPCLVECSDGSLIMVARYFDFLCANGGEDYAIPRTKSFRVFKLDSINSSWVEVKNIGNDILFLGLNSSFSISSRHFPECKGNRIYFADSHFSIFGKLYKQEDSDIGVFSLEEGTLEPLPGLKSHPKFFWPPPIWIKIA